MIHFKSVRWKNFLSTGNDGTQIDLDTDGATLIVGDNGSGKSTFLDALCFGLFGKAFRKINKTQLVNTVNGKDCEVEVEFNVGSRHYRVYRSIKSTTNSGGEFDIYENGKILDKDAARKDTQNYLERNILKLNFNSFTQIVILGSTTFVPFMQLSAGKRREVIEDLLDIRIFTAMNMLLKERIQENKDQIENCKRDIQLQNEKLKVHDGYLKELKQSNLERIKKLETEIEEYKEEITQYEEEIEVKKSKIDDLEKRMNDNNTKSKIDNLSNIEDKIETRMKKVDKELNFYSSSNTCPTCHQHIDDDFKSLRIEEKQETRKELEEGINSLKEKMMALEHKYKISKECSDQIDKLNRDISSHHHKIKSLEDYIKKTREEIESTKNASGNIDQENDTIEKLKEEIKKLEDKKKSLINKRSTLNVASDMLKDKGIKTQIIKQYIPVINKLVNKYLASLDFFVNFELDEAFNEVIKSRHRDEFSYDSFSEGEKARIDLSLLFAWRAIAKMKNSASTNLLILDEVFDGSLDSTGCDEVTKILSTIEDDTNVFVISHKTDQMIDKFQNVIKFEKRKSFSTVIKE